MCSSWEMMGPVFAWPVGRWWAGTCPSSGSLTLILLLWPREDEKEGFARGILEAAAGQRLCSKGAVKVNSENTGHGHQGAEEHSRDMTQTCLLQHGHPTCPLSLPGTTGTGAAVHSQISISEPRKGQLVEQPTFTAAGSCYTQTHTHTHSNS